MFDHHLHLLDAYSIFVLICQKLSIGSSNLTCKSASYSRKIAAPQFDRLPVNAHRVLSKLPPVPSAQCKTPKTICRIVLVNIQTLTRLNWCHISICVHYSVPARNQSQPILSIPYTSSISSYTSFIRPIALFSQEDSSNATDITEIQH